MASKGICSAAAVFAIAMIAGLYSGTKSWKGVVYMTEGTRFQNGRTPAAIKRELDFSKLDGAELITATQKRLVTAARTISRDGLVGVELGHFVTRDSNGQRRLACDTSYNRITLRFEADGIASAGEKPMMEIDGPCQASMKDVASIEPIWIPVSKLLDTKPVDMDVDFHEGVKFRFHNMNMVWPVSWNLLSVRLYNNVEAGREVNITSRDLRELRQSPLVVNWQEATREPAAKDRSK